MERYGYIRISTKEQNPGRQYAALEECDISRENIYMDRMSGKDFHRPQYRRLLGRLRQGDMLVVKSIDRLGRDYGEILEQWRRITKEIGADIRVIDMPLLDTDARHGDLTGVFIADMVLQILAYVAETERAFIRQRQAEGIAVARANGIRFGREKCDVPDGFEEYFRLWRDGDVSTRKAAGALGMSHSTFYRRCREMMGREKSCSK